MPYKDRIKQLAAMRELHKKTRDSDKRALMSATETFDRTNDTFYGVSVGEEKSLPVSNEEVDVEGELEVKGEGSPKNQVLAGLEEWKAEAEKIVGQFKELAVVWQKKMKTDASAGELVQLGYLRLCNALNVFQFVFGSSLEQKAKEYADLVNYLVSWETLGWSEKIAKIFQFILSIKMETLKHLELRLKNNSVPADQVESALKLKASLESDIKVYGENLASLMKEESSGAE